MLPPLTENLNRPTMDLLEVYSKAQGVVLCCGDAPARVDGRPSDRAQIASKQPGWKRAGVSEVPTMLLARNESGFGIQRPSSDKGNLFHHRRVVGDGEFVLLVNTSIDARSTGTITSKAQSIERWDPDSGRISAYPFEKAETGVRATFTLPPCGSQLLFLSQKARAPKKQPIHFINVVDATTALRIVPLEDNVLTLDYVDITAGGETKKNLYFYRASQFAFAANGMPRNPWDSSVQFKDELITKKFDPNSGFEAIYRFTIEEQLPQRLSIVIERPDLYTITCNGKKVSAGKNAWWLDKAFGRIDITKAAQLGENIVTIQAAPFTIYHELESAYVLGTFRLKAVDCGFVILGESEPTLALGSWKGQGYPLYSAGVSYSGQFNVSSRRAGKYVVELGKWYGSVAEVIVNKKSAGYIACQPWQCDVTKLIKRGTNTVEVRVIGTLKNTLGPHHNGTLRGSAWPASFQKAPENGPAAGQQL